MSWTLIDDIIAASGQPVAGHTLTVPEMQRAVAEGRALAIHFTSCMGDSEATFGFADSFGLTADGGVHPTYLVFPRPIPMDLRRDGTWEWEEIDEVYAAFGVDA